MTWTDSVMTFYSAFFLQIFSFILCAKLYPVLMLSPNEQTHDSDSDTDSNLFWQTNIFHIMILMIWNCKVWQTKIPNQDCLSQESRAPITCLYKKLRSFVWATIDLCQPYGDFPGSFKKKFSKCTKALSFLYKHVIGTLDFLQSDQVSEVTTSCDNFDTVLQSLKPFGAMRLVLF